MLNKIIPLCKQLSSLYVKDKIDFMKNVQNKEIFTDLLNEV